MTKRLLTLGLALLGQDVVIFISSNMAAVVRAGRFSIWLLVVNFNFIFLIGLQFRADVFQIPQQRQALPVMRHAMATVHNFNEDQNNQHDNTADASQKQKSCKANTQKPTHICSTFVFAPTPHAHPPP